MIVARLFCAPAATAVDRLSNIVAGVLSVAVGVAAVVWLAVLLLLVVDISMAAAALEFIASTFASMGSGNRLVVFVVVVVGGVVAVVGFVVVVRGVDVDAVVLPVVIFTMLKCHTRAMRV